MHDPREHFALANRHVVETNALRVSGISLSGCAELAATRELQRTCCAFYFRRAASCWVTKRRWNARWSSGARFTPTTLGISFLSGLEFQRIDENHLSLTRDRADGRQHDRGGNAPIGNEGQIVERRIDGFNGVVASRLHSVDVRERKRAQESYRCECCSFWQGHLSGLGVLFKRPSRPPQLYIGTIEDDYQPRETLFTCTWRPVDTSDLHVRTVACAGLCCA